MSESIRQIRQVPDTGVRRDAFASCTGGPAVLSVLLRLTIFLSIRSYTPLFVA